MVYPRGNGAQHENKSLSLYLAVAEDDQAAFGLSRCATFKLTLLAQLPGCADVVKEATHTFTSKETDWGERAKRARVGGRADGGRPSPIAPPLRLCSLSPERHSSPHPLLPRADASLSLQQRLLSSSSGSASAACSPSSAASCAAPRRPSSSPWRPSL